jgi:hypothetical protein
MMALGSALAANAQRTSACGQDARYSALDFWLGEWQVVDADGQAVGTNRIEKGQSGCLIEEHWTSTGGGTGQSLNYFDPEDGQWRQHWVDEGGSIVHYEGGMDDGVLRFRGRHVGRDGTVTMARAALEPIGDGRLRHLIEHSTDDGGSWSTYFVGTYIPVGQSVVAAAPMEVVASPPAVPSTEPAGPDPEPVVTPLAAPVPQETPASAPAQPQAARQKVREGSDVKAVTRELQREEIPQAQAPELVMASPMVLEVKPGNVAFYPENAAWSTMETGGFICDEVVLREVEVSYRTKRDTVFLVIDSTLFTHRRIKKVDLLVELSDDGGLVATQSAPKIRLGLNIPAHGEEGLVAPVEMELTPEQFEMLFGGEGRPILRFTLTCPSSD